MHNLPPTPGSIVLTSTVAGFLEAHHWSAAWLTQEAWMQKSDILCVCVRTCVSEWHRYLCNMGNSRKQCSSQWPAARIYWGINGKGQSEFTYDGATCWQQRIAASCAPPRTAGGGRREAGSRVSGGSFGKRRGEDDGGEVPFLKEELRADGCGRSTRVLWVFPCLIHTQSGADFKGFVSSHIFKWVYDNLGPFLTGIRHIYLPTTKTTPQIPGYTINPLTFLGESRITQKICRVQEGKQV